MKLCLPGIVVVSLAASLAPAAFAQDSPAKPAGPQPAAAAARSRTSDDRSLDTLRVLASRIEHAEFDEPFGDVLEWFKSQGLRNLIINWNRLARTGDITRDTPIVLVMDDVSLGELLDMVLEVASDQAARPQDGLTFHVSNGIVRIATREAFDRELFTRTYYVEDLLRRVTDNELAPYLAVGSEFAYVREVQPVVASGAAAQAPVVDVIPTGTIIGPGNPALGRPDFEEIRQEELDKLIEMIRSIRPQTWDTAGGPGTITAFGDRLVVSQNVEMHEIIGGTFSQVQQFRRRPVP